MSASLSRKCLIVEDDPILGDAFRETLSFAGLQTQLVQDGKTALSVLAGDTPDLVILDLHLPEVSGPEIFEHIRRDQRLASTRVVIISADASRAERLRGRADLILCKPVGFSELLRLADQFAG